MSQKFTFVFNGDKLLSAAPCNMTATWNARDLLMFRIMSRALRPVPTPDRLLDLAQCEMGAARSSRRY
jgi:hypothetical protein